jgi:Dodecin
MTDSPQPGAGSLTHCANGRNTGGNHDRRTRRLDHGDFNQRSQDAVQTALARPTKTLHGITGLEVTSGKIAEYRVSLALTFILE